MDLPSCPSCGQSVLDENPETCPFCGASMSGGGAKSSATAKKPAPKEKKKKLTSKDDDPFAIETSSEKAAVRVALRKSKGRTHEVTCPMCETTGYVPEAAASKSVKCANPACMVPIFEAPPVVKEEEPEPESSGNSLFMLVFGVIFLSAIGAAVWFFVLREEPKSPDELDNLAENQNNTTPQRIEYNPVFGDDKKDDNAPDKPFDPIAFRKELLEEAIPQIARQREWNSQINRPADCRQLLAEAFARTGQLEQAKAQLPRIDQSRPEAFFNKRLMPLVEIAWRENDAAKRAKLIEEAERAAAEAPTAGRMRFDDLSGLAALLVAEGRSDDAVKWIETSVKGANISNPQQLDRLRQISSQLRVLRDLAGYPIFPTIDHPAYRWAQPEWVTVTMLLVAHQQDEKALDWISRAPDDRIRADSLLAYSRWKALNGEMTADEIIQLVAEEPPAAKTRILADAASFFSAGGDNEGARKVLAVASAQLSELTGGTEYQIPGPVKLLDHTPPNPSPILNRVLALFALARAQDAVGESDEVWNTVRAALKLTRSIGPTPAGLAARPHDQDDAGAEAVKKQLREKLEIENENTLRIRFNSYVKKLKELESAADLRIQTIQTLLSEALEWGQAVNVWGEMQTRIDETDEDLKEPFLELALLTEVKAAFEKENAETQLSELKRRIGQNLPSRNPRQIFASDLDRMIGAGDFSQLDSAINESGIDRERLQMTLMDRLLPIAESGDLQLVQSIIISVPKRIRRTRMDLTVMREEISYFVGRIAGKIGQPQKYQALLDNQLLPPVEEVSAWSGLAVGLNPDSKVATQQAQSN